VLVLCCWRCEAAAGSRLLYTSVGPTLPPQASSCHGAICPLALLLKLLVEAAACAPAEKQRGGPREGGLLICCSC
jgi:hypothetical protein